MGIVLAIPARTRDDFMSHYMTALAMRQTGIKPAAKIVLYWLADHHNGETGECFPSIARLAKCCEMDKATVKRHLASLEDAGLIQRQHRHRENGSFTSTKYTLILSENHNDGVGENCAKGGRKMRQGVGANCAPHNLGNINLGKEPFPPNPPKGGRRRKRTQKEMMDAAMEILRRQDEERERQH